MANYTAAELLAVIDEANIIGDGTPIFNGMRYFEYVQDPKQRLYPSIDIKTSQPQSPDSSFQLTDKKTKFEISVYIKWGNRQQDTDNLDILERHIVDAIKATTLTTGKLILENNDFAHGDIQKNPLNVNGIQSVLVLYFIERAANVGIIGLQQHLDIGSISNLQIIGEIGADGFNDTRRQNDKGYTLITRGWQASTRYWEYQYTKTNFEIIRALIKADAAITVTLHEETQADTVLIGKPVYQRMNTRFDGQKTVILQFEVNDYSDS